MILYHAVTFFQVLWIIVYHETKLKGKKGVLVLAESLRMRLSDRVKISLENMFEVFFFPYEKITKVPTKSSVQRQSEYIKNKVEELYKDYISYDLCQFEEINVAGYHFYFTLILLNHGIKFNIIEEAVGMLSRPEVLYSIVKKLSRVQLNVALENELLYAENELIQKKYCSFQYQVESFCDEKAEDFDLMTTMLLNNDGLVDGLLDIFIGNNEKIQISNNSMLLLTQHFANLQIMSFEKQALIYQYFVDYFASDMKLVIKPHPDDVMYYSKLFPNAYIIKDKFPSELLPFIFSELPSGIGTISSTAIFSIEKMFKKVIKFTTEYEKEFVMINKYYSALRILSQLSRNKTIQTFGCNKEIVYNLVSYSELQEKEVEVEIVNNPDEINWQLPLLIERFDFSKMNSKYMREAGENIIFLTTESEDGYCSIFDYLTSDNIIPIVLEKRKDREDYFFSEEMNELLYYYSCKEENRIMEKKISFEKELHNTGITISKNKLSDDKIKIRSLEGILNSTEKRLKLYIENNNELLKKVEELESGVTLNNYIKKEQELNEILIKRDEEIEQLKREIDRLKLDLEQED